MIKKSVFEQELISGMQIQLHKQASAERPDLVKAGECLHAAMEILEQAGLQSRADQVLSVLHKIAASDPSKHIQNIPTIQSLIQAGLTPEDLQNFGKGDSGAKVKMNLTLRKMGLSEEEIAHFIGKHNVVPEHELQTYEQFNSWMKNPMQMDSGPVLPGQEISMESIAAKHKKHPADKPHNGHTKDLTPERMIANLMHHGTVFNMADDGSLDVNGADFDPEVAEVFDAHNVDDLDAEDVLNIDIEQPDNFEEEWKAWKDMQEPSEEDVLAEPPPTLRAIPSRPPVPMSEIESDFDKIGLQDITDADDQASDQVTLEDFEDELSSSPK